ncbi:MAG: FxsA family protein [Devosia sp.]
MAFRAMFLVLLAIPLIEIALFIVIGQAIGVWPTLAGVILGAVIGSMIVRHQGLKLLGEIRNTMGRGQLPGLKLADAMLISIAGVLIAVPGYFTDLVGLLLVLPPVRTAIYGFLKRRMRVIGEAAGTGAGAGRPKTIELDDDQFRPR